MERAFHATKLLLLTGMLTAQVAVVACSEPPEEGKQLTEEERSEIEQFVNNPHGPSLRGCDGDGEYPIAQVGEICDGAHDEEWESAQCVSDFCACIGCSVQ